jgi:hypothetical protein
MEQRSGFIMTEVLVGVALVMLLVGITCVHIGAYRYTCMQQQIYLFALTWRQLQQCAMARNKEQVMLLDETGNRYQCDGVWYDLPSTIRFGFLPESKGPPSTPTTPIRSAITFPGKKVSCFPDGTIQAGTVYLVDDKKSSMYALTSGVSAVSFLRKYRYDGTWHGY